MKNLLSIILTFSVATMACVPLEERQDEDIRTEETRSLGSFNGISVGESIKLTIEKGDENIARIETSNVDTKKVLLDISGSHLKVHMENTKFKFWSGNSWSRSVKVHLTYTDDLAFLMASSSSTLTGKSVIETDQLSIKVSSSARADLKVDAKDVSIDVSSSGSAEVETDSKELHAKVTSSGKLSVSGSTKFQKIKVSSSGRYLAEDLKSEIANARVSSSGTAEISVSEELTGAASSSGSIFYQGNPDEVTVDTSSSGRVRKSN